MHSAVAIPVDSAVQPVRSDVDGAAQFGKVPIIEVAYKNDMWWSIPGDISQQLYAHHLQSENAVYVWDWGNHRTGSWQPDDQETSINRYTIDFDKMEQENMDNGRRRTIRIAWLDPAGLPPRWTGQIPEGTATTANY